MKWWITDSMTRHGALRPGARLRMRLPCRHHSDQRCRHHGGTVDRQVTPSAMEEPEPVALPIPTRLAGRAVGAAFRVSRAATGLAVDSTFVAAGLALDTAKA